MPSPFPAVATPEVWASWEGKSAAAILQRIRRKQIPPECLLRPTERIILIDVSRYLEYLRDKRRRQLEQQAAAEEQRAAGTAT